MDQIGLLIIILILVFFIVIDVFFRYKDRNHKYMEWNQINQVKGEFLEKNRNFNQSLDDFEKSVKRNQENFDKIISSITTSLNRNIDGKIDYFDDSIKNSAQITRKILEKNIEDFQQSISTLGNNFNDSIIHFKKAITHSEKITDKFLNKLSYVKDETFKSKTQGILGEMLVKSSLGIILGESTKGKIWFDPKEKATYLKRFREDLKFCGIEPDYLIRISKDSWIIIDSKAYLPGEEALIRINNFENNSNLDEDQLQQARDDINDWINLLIKNSRKMIRKGYLDSFKGPNFLWVVAPDRLVEYYLQKYSTVYLDEGVLNKVVIPITDTRAQLVSFSSLTWMLIDLKARGFKSMAEADFYTNPKWYRSLKTVIEIARDVLDYNEEMMSKIINTLEVLKEFESNFINNEFSTKLKELETLTFEFSQYFHSLEDTSFSPRTAGFQFIPSSSELQSKDNQKPQISLDSFL